MGRLSKFLDLPTADRRLLPGTPIFSRVAGFLLALSSDVPWNSVGIDPAILYDGGIHGPFWHSRKGAFRWYALSRFLLCRAPSLDLLFDRRGLIRRKSNQQCLFDY